MEFLNQCELLKIEDILPFFQDFVTIDHFKVRMSISSVHVLSQGSADIHNFEILPWTRHKLPLLHDQSDIFAFI